MGQKLIWKGPIGWILITVARVSIYQYLNHSGVNICIAPDDAEEDLDDDNANADDDININEVLGMCLAQTPDFTKHLIRR